MELFLCANNISVKYVLARMEEDKTLNGVVLTDQLNIFDFFKFLSNERLRVFYIDSTIGVFQIDRLIRGRRYVKDIFKTFGGFQSVHFYHQAFAGFLNWVIVYSKKYRIPIVFHRSVEDLRMDKAKISIRYVITKFVYSKYFSTDVLLLNNGLGITPKLSNVFFKKNGIKETRDQISGDKLETISKVLANKYKLSTHNKTILLLTGAVMDSNQVEQAEYNAKIKLLLESIKDYQVFCKCHPRYVDETYEERELPHIDSFIPINLLLPHFDVVIGYNSYTLVEASQLGKQSISLLNYLEPKDKDRKSVGLSYLSGYNINFPKNMTEILQIIIDNGNNK